MSEQEKLELIGLRAFYNYFFDNLYAEGYMLIANNGDIDGALSDCIDYAYTLKEQAEAHTILSEPNKLTIDTNELPAWANWAARDANGELWMYEGKPTKETTYWDHSGGYSEVIDGGLYPSIKWTDPQPTKIVRRQPL